MGFHHVLVCILLTATMHTCLRAQGTFVCSEQERLSLLKFKQSVKDEFGMLSSWVGIDCCEWKGVECDVATGSVVSLRLTGFNIWNSYYFPESAYAVNANSLDSKNYYPFGEDYYLVGDEVDSCLGELRHLKYLDLSGNDFQGSPIPEFIGSFKNLSYLNLSNAGFNGVIPPHMGNLSNLEVLDLRSPNQDLIADDMAWLFGLSLLKHLDLSGTDLRRAQNVDMVFYMIPLLVNVSLSHCSLTNVHLGPHLNSSRTLPNIQRLDLSKNFFRDQPPGFLQNMTSLSFADLSNIDLSLEWNLSYLLNMIPSLSELHLSNCGITNTNLSPRYVNFTTISNIQHLDLSRNSIEGKFPSLLTNMSSLRVLELYENFLNLSIPFMPKLLKLDISWNKFTHIEHVGIWRHCHVKYLSVSQNYLGEEFIGPSTNTSKCSQYALEVVYLDHNELNGSIPESLNLLNNLKVLDLSSNRLTNLIPESLGRLRTLEVLDLSSNELSGTIPVSIGQLGRINFLNVSTNYLEGVVFEHHFANLWMLKYLDISSNSKLAFNVSCEWIPPFQLRIVRLGSCNISKFPQWIQTQKTLKMLMLSNTGIMGPLPTWLQTMPVIPHLDLSHNQLSGPLTNLPLGHPFNGSQDEYRGSLLLQNNSFNGPIPMSLCKRTALEVLDLSENRLTGEIPNCLENLQRLRAMIFSSNGLSGVIPKSIGRNSLLSWLHLNDNNFTGELPQELGNLQHLWILDLGDNELSGKIPESIAQLTELMVLRLHNNNFTGIIPPSLCKNPCLQILDVARNSLQGTIPRCVGELSGMAEADYCRHYLYSEENLVQVLKGRAFRFSKRILQLVVTMDLSSNELDGEIPEELTRLTRLVSLNLSYNHLSGIIPNNIGNIRNLESLDLTENNLTGIIPPSIVLLNSLGVLNLSYNNLSGQIPIGTQIQSFLDISFSGNEHLCGKPLPIKCSIHDVVLQPTTRTRKKVWWSSHLHMICGFATGFCGVIGVLFLNKRWRDQLYRFAEVAIDNIYVQVAIRVAKIKRRPEAA